jgi:SprT protein
MYTFDLAGLTTKFQFLLYISRVKNIEEKLARYLPEGSESIIADWIRRTNCEFRITRARKSKFGDYRHPFQGARHKISVNHNLNKYAFLITTVHEFAHLKTWLTFGNRVRPHGPEWKAAFQQLLTPFLEKETFPAELALVIQNYLRNPSASSCTDLTLFRALSAYDDKPNTNGLQFIHLEKLAEGQYFQTRDGRKFQKQRRMRVRYRCEELKTNRTYLFSPIAEVAVIDSLVR